MASNAQIQALRDEYGGILTDVLLSDLTISTLIDDLGYEEAVREVGIRAAQVAPVDIASRLTNRAVSTSPTRVQEMGGSPFGWTETSSSSSDSSTSSGVTFTEALRDKLNFIEEGADATPVGLTDSVQHNTLGISHLQDVTKDIIVSATDRTWVNLTANGNVRVYIGNANRSASQLSSVFSQFGYRNTTQTFSGGNIIYLAASPLQHGQLGNYRVSLGTENTPISLASPVYIGNGTGGAAGFTLYRIPSPVPHAGTGWIMQSHTGTVHEWTGALTLRAPATLMFQNRPSLASGVQLGISSTTETSFSTGDIITGVSATDNSVTLSAGIFDVAILSNISVDSDRISPQFVIRRDSNNTAIGYSDTGYGRDANATYNNYRLSTTLYLSSETTINFFMQNGATGSNNSATGLFAMNNVRLIVTRFV